MYLGEPLPKPKRTTPVVIPEEIKNLVTTWCKENPYTVYADRDDVISDEMAEKLLDAQTVAELEEAKSDIENEIDEGMWNYHAQIEDEQFKECVKEIELNFEDAEEKDATLEFFRENFKFCTSDFIKTCVRHWSGHIVATVLDKNGEPFESPCLNDHSLEEMRRLKAKWKRSFKLSKEDAEQLTRETMYSGTYLKICGTIDLWDLWEKGKPITRMKLNKHCSIIIHCGGNGSGNCWEPTINVDRWVKVKVGLDHPRYGVQAVYGMVGSFWRNEIETK